MNKRNNNSISDYEVLKETKIAYEYINDILKNSEIIMDNEVIEELESTMNTLSIVYNSAHNNLEHPDKEEQLLTDACCKNCNNKLFISENIDYSYQCLECDENFYDFEVNSNNVWYENEKKEKSNMLSSFNLEISYDPTEKMMYIYTEDGSGAKYSCDNVNDFVKNLKFYCENYLVEQYEIEIWETDWHRDAGESFIYDETFDDYESALNMARKLFDDNNYASIEIFNAKGVVYCKDNESEEFYYDDEKISYVSNEIVSEYIDNWTNHKEQTFKEDKLYCKDGDCYVAIDDSTNDCWVEQFNSEKEAQNWLLGKDLEEDLDNEI